MPERRTPPGPGVVQRAARLAAGLLGRNSAIVRRLRPWYERLLDAVTRGHGFVRVVNDAEAFYVNPRMRHLFPSVYEPDTFALLRQGVREGAVCLNVGAHVGIYTLALARWAGAAGRVIAFEPNPPTADVLADHVRRNRLADRVTVVREAVGSVSAEQPFYATGLEGFSRGGPPHPGRGAGGERGGRNSTPWVPARRCEGHRRAGR